MVTVAERGLWLPDAADRKDLRVFVERARRLDPAAVIRLRERDAATMMSWAATGFDVLAVRGLNGRLRPADLCAGADALLAGIDAADPSGYVDPGWAMDSAWRGALPPEHGFAHIDDVPAEVILELARRGAELAREHTAVGPPASLLDQDVVVLDDELGIPMRCVFALTGMGFVPGAGADEVVRVRTTELWLRIDARFGSVYRRRGDPALVLG